MHSLDYTGLFFFFFFLRLWRDGRGRIADAARRRRTLRTDPRRKERAERAEDEGGGDVDSVCIVQSARKEPAATATAPHTASGGRVAVRLRP